MSLKKIEDSLKNQKDQLTQLERMVEQLKGSIAALEYVQTLNLQDPDESTPDSTPAE